MNLKIAASPLSGAITAPPSKSAAHRAIVAAALANGKSRIENVSLSDDIKATLGAVAALGAKVTCADGAVEIEGGRFSETAEIDCGESGTTLRLFIPLAAALGTTARFSGRGRLPERTYAPLVSTLSERGAVFDRTEGLPLRVKNRIFSGIYGISGNISSQFISGLLFALPLLEGDSRIIATGKLESAGYVEMTLATLSDFGITVERDKNEFFVRGGQSYKPREYRVEGDFSNAAFFLVAGALGEGVSVSGLSPDSRQGDRRILDILKAMGADVKTDGFQATVKNNRLDALDVDASDIPDLIPALSVALALAEGQSRVYNAARLRLKESDRIASVLKTLRAFGVDCAETSDGFRVRGAGLVRGDADGAGDHRVVMSASVAAAFADGVSTLSGAEAANKSYPGFFSDFIKLGGKLL